MRLNHLFELKITANNEFDLRRTQGTQTINFKNIERERKKDEEFRLQKKNDTVQEKKRGTGFIKSLAQGEAIVAREQDVAGRFSFRDNQYVEYEEGGVTKSHYFVLTNIALIMFKMHDADIPQEMYYFRRMKDLHI